MNKQIDEDLLRDYQKGSLKAFEAFYDRNYKLVFHYLLSRVPSEEIAEDLLQDSFLKLHKSIMSYNPNQKALPWLFTIVRNTLIDFYRKKKELPVENMDLYRSENLGKPSHEKEEIEELLKILSKEDRRILENRFFKEKTYEEMAEEESSTLIALRKRVSRILAKLRPKEES